MKNYRSLKKFLDWAWGSKKGFTLAEIMVAAGLVGVLSLALVNIMKNINTSSKKAYQDANIFQVKSLITRTIMEQGACSKTMENLTLSTVESPWGVEVANGIFERADNPPGGPDPSNVAKYDSGTLFGAGASGTIRIERIGVRGFQRNDGTNNYALAGGTYTANTWTDPSDGLNKARGTAIMEVRIRRSSRDAADIADDQAQKHVQGNLYQNIRIPIRVVINTANNRILSCYGAETEYVEASCTALGGVLDDSGLCVEIDAVTNSDTGNIGGPALTVTAATDTAGGALNTEIDSNVGTANPPLVIRGGFPTAGIQIDGDEIQSITGTLKINEHGRDIELGTDTPLNTTTVNGNFVAERNVNLGSDPSANTLTIGNSGDTVNIGTTTNISGTTTFTSGTVTSNDGVVMNLNSNTINIANSGSDYLNVRGRIRNNGSNSPTGGAVYIEDNLTVTGSQTTNGNTTIQGDLTVNGGDIILPTMANTTSDNRVPNIAWVKERIARTLAPAASDVTGIMTDIISNSTSNDTALGVVREYVCDSIRVYNKSGGYATNGGSGCYFNTPDTRCDVSGTCSRVCIGTDCRTNWNVSVSQTSRTACRYVSFVYSYTTVNPSNSTAGSGGYLNYLCAANEMVNGISRRYLHFSSGVHGYRPYLYCCRPVLN